MPSPTTTPPSKKHSKTLHASSSATHHHQRKQKRRRKRHGNPLGPAGRTNLMAPHSLQRGGGGGATNSTVKHSKRRNLSTSVGTRAPLSNPFQTHKNVTRFQNSMLSIGISLGNYILQRGAGIASGALLSEELAATNLISANVIMRCITCLSFHFLFTDLAGKSLIHHDESLQKTINNLLHMLDTNILEQHVRKSLGELRFEYYKAMWYICVLGLKMNSLEAVEKGNGSLANATTATASNASHRFVSSANLKSFAEILSPAVILLSTLLPDHANSFELEYLDMDEITDYELSDVQELDSDEDHAIPVRITLPQTEASIRTFLLPIPLSLQFALLLRLKIALSIKLFDVKSRETSQLPSSSLTAGNTSPMIGDALIDVLNLSESIAKEYGFSSFILWYRALVQERNQEYAQAYKSYVLCAESALEGSLMKPIALYRAALLCSHFSSSQEANDALELQNGEIATKQRLLYKTLEEKAQNMVLQGIKYEDYCFTSDLEELNSLISVREMATKRWFPQNYNFHPSKQDDGETNTVTSEGDPSGEATPRSGENSTGDGSSAAPKPQQKSIFRSPNLSTLLNLNTQKDLIVDDEADLPGQSSLWRTGIRLMRESVEWYQWLLFLILVFMFVVYLHFVAWKGTGLKVTHGRGDL